jgi:hypothetical protein
LAPAITVYATYALIARQFVSASPRSDICLRLQPVTRQHDGRRYMLQFGFSSRTYR